MPLTLTPWHDPPSLLDLKPEDVHLWRFPLACLTSLEHLLDEQELQRAKRLRSPDKARAFVIGRARLRQILSGYLDMDPNLFAFLMVQQASLPSSALLTRPRSIWLTQATGVCVP